MRLMGRLLQSAKDKDEKITDLMSIYTPKHYDTVVAAIQSVAQYDFKSGTYKAPAVAQNLCTYIKQVGAILETELIKTEKNDELIKVQNFLKILAEDASTSVLKAAFESQCGLRREKKVIMPSTDDIKQMLNYLNNERSIYSTKLNEKFSYSYWLNLNELTMATLIVFNRRRPGDIQNIRVSEYKTQTTIDETVDKHLYGSLDEESKKLAKKYYRFGIRTKKNRDAGVLIPTDVRDNIELLLRYRKDAQVPESNIYLFGLPSLDDSRVKVIGGCQVMRKFSIASGAKNPELLRATKLRKHIATMCVKLDLSENVISELANFMGHADKIHKDIYQQPQVEREIFRVSKLLEAGLGQSDSEDEDDIENAEELDANRNTYHNLSPERIHVASGNSSFEKDHNQKDEQRSFEKTFDNYQHSSNKRSQLSNNIDKFLTNVRSNSIDNAGCKRKYF